MNDEFNLVDPYKGNPDFFDDSSLLMSSMYREVGEIVPDIEIFSRPASSISMEDRELTLLLGDSKLIRIIPMPSCSSVPDLVWSSSNLRVAAVLDNAGGLSTDDSSTALLTTKGVGTAIITAENSEGLFCRATVRVVSRILPKYTITYDANGGTGSVVDENSPYEEGTDVTVLENHFISPSSDKIFDHWNTEADDSGDSYEAGETLTIMGDTTLYAIYVDLDLPITRTYFKFIYEGEEMPLEKSSNVLRVSELHNPIINSYLLDSGYTQEDFNRIFTIYYNPDAKMDVDHPEDGYYLVITDNGNITYEQSYTPFARCANNSCHEVQSNLYSVIFKECSTFITWYNYNENGDDLITPFEPGETIQEALGSSFLPLATRTISGKQSSTRKWVNDRTDEELTLSTILPDSSVLAVAYNFVLPDDDYPSKEPDDDDDDDNPTPPSKGDYVVVRYTIYPDVRVYDTINSNSYEDDESSLHDCGALYNFRLMPLYGKNIISNDVYPVSIKYSTGSSISYTREGDYNYQFRLPSYPTTIIITVTASKSLPDDDDDYEVWKSSPIPYDDDEEDYGSSSKSDPEMDD